MLDLPDGIFGCVITRFDNGHSVQIKFENTFGSLGIFNF